jgi:hypothetical protein
MANLFQLVKINSKLWKELNALIQWFPTGVPLKISKDAAKI